MVPDEVLADGDDVGGDVRAESTDLLVGVVRRLADVLVLEVCVHRDVSLESVERQKNSSKLSGVDYYCLV